MSSKYTAMVRSICEQKAGLLEGAEYPNVKDVITQARESIFDFDYPIFDEAYRPTLETNILRHYYFYEIGFETYAQWKLRLEATLNEIMPQYNAMYEALLYEINPTYNKDLWISYGEKTGSEEQGSDARIENRTDNLSHTSTRTDDLTEANNATVTDKGNLAGNTTRTDDLTSTTDGTEHTAGQRTYDDTNRFSDTPQGGLNAVDIRENEYLTDVRMIHDSEQTTTDKTIHSEVSDTGTQKTDEKQESTNTQTTETSLKNTGTQKFANEDNRTENESENRQNQKQINGNRDYVQHIAGYDKSPVDNLLKWLEMIRNIDLLVIKELKPLFMGLWQ